MIFWEVLYNNYKNPLYLKDFAYLNNKFIIFAQILDLFKDLNTKLSTKYEII